MKTLPEILKVYLAKNAGWHNKAAITSIHFPYQDGSGRTYSSETVGRKLRLLAEASEIQVKTEHGQAFYARNEGVEAPFRWGYDTSSGVAKPYKIYL